jgi:hypothetical protein
MENSNIFHHAKKYNLQKNCSKKKPKSLKILYNFVTNLKFQHKPKNIIFHKSLYKNRPIIIIIIINLGGQNPLC